jgi:hydroxymethylpyrimidine/phosphomethylpyrimidine kinase
MPSSYLPIEEEESEDDGPSDCVLTFNANDASGACGISADITTIASVGAHALPFKTISQWTTRL